MKLSGEDIWDTTKTKIKHMKIGNQLRDLVFKRTGIPSKELHCPRSKSSMTPCAARDGSLAQTRDEDGEAICVGCECQIRILLMHEKEKHRR